MVKYERFRAFERLRTHYNEPEWDEYFSSKQSDTEIAECIGAALSTY